MHTQHWTATRPFVKAVLMVMMILFVYIIVQKQSISSDFYPQKQTNLDEKPNIAVAFVGVKKCGTGALKMFLQMHPLLRVADIKHVCRKDEQKTLPTENEVQSLLRQSKIPIVFDNHCFFNLEQFDKLRKFDKLIILLRDPVSRAFSDYKHMSRVLRNLKMPPFEQLVSDTIADLKEKENKGHFREYISGLRYENMAGTAVSLGIYYEYVHEFYKRFDEKDILLLSGDELKVNPASVLQKVESFLGISRVFTNDRFVRSNKTGMYCITREKSPDDKLCLDSKAAIGTKYIPPPDTLSLMQLRDFYRPFNEKLYQLTKQTFHWT